MSASVLGLIIWNFELVSRLNSLVYMNYSDCHSFNYYRQGIICCDKNDCTFTYRLNIQELREANIPKINISEVLEK